MVADELLRLGAEAWLAGLSDAEFERVLRITRPGHAHSGNAALEVTR
jgi:hypothetical protein